MTAPNSPRITIITPCLNQARFVERCLCSVLDQEYDNLEYMVVDLGSTDGSGDIIDYYQDNVTCWYNAGETSPAKAINEALAEATGEIVGILPADALYLPGVLYEVARRMMQDDRPTWLVGNAKRIDLADQVIGSLTVEPGDTLADYLLYDRGFFPGAATFYRRSAIDCRGGFAPDMRQAYSYEMACYQLGQGHKPTVLRSSIAAIRQHPRAVSAVALMQEGEEYIRAAERYRDRLPLEQRDRLMKSCEQRRRVYAMARSQIRLSDAREHLWQQLLRRPSWLQSERYRHALLDGVAKPAAVFSTARRAA